MKDLNMLIWVTQLGLSVVVPMAGFVLLGVWLCRSCGWGQWAIWAGVILGIYSAVEGLRASLKILERMGKHKKEDEPPAVSFNDHD